MFDDVHGQITGPLLHEVLQRQHSLHIVLKHPMSRLGTLCPQEQIQQYSHLRHVTNRFLRCHPLRLVNLIRQCYTEIKQSFDKMEWFLCK